MELKDLAFQSALRCIESQSLLHKKGTETPPLSEDRKDSIVRELHRFCGISPPECESLLAAAKEFASNPKNLLQILKERIMIVIADQHPYYSQATEHWKSNWMKREQSNVASLMRNVISNSTEFYGELIVTIKQVACASTMDSVLPNPYVVVQIGKQHFSTSAQERTLLACWDTENQFVFNFEPTQDTNGYPRVPLEISVWDKSDSHSDSLLDQLNITIDSENLESGQTVEISREMDEGNAVIVLKLAYIFDEKEYFEYFSASHHAKLKKLCLETPVKYHQCYSYLLARLMGIRTVKLPTDGSGTMQRIGSSNSLRYSNSDERPTLSENGSWLLSQYALFYGIEELYTHISLLYCLDDILEAKEEHVMMVHSSLKRISALKHSVGITKPEEKTLEDASRSLLEKFNGFLIRFVENFPLNHPPEFLQSATEVYEMLSGSPINPSALTDDYVKVRLKSLISDIKPGLGNTNTSTDGGEEESLSSLLEQFHASELQAFSSAIIKETNLLNSHFASAFIRTNSEVPIAGLALSRFKEILYEATRKFCERDSSLDDPNAFKLYFAMKEFTKWLTQLPFVVPHDGKKSSAEFSLSQLFYGFIVRFLNDTLKTMNNHFIAEICSSDDLEPISEHFLHSQSAVQLFTHCSQNYQFLTSLEMGEPTFLGQYAEIVCSAVRVFVDCLVQQQVKSSFEDNESDAFQITKELCVTLNNIEFCKTELQTLKSSMEEDLDLFSNEGKQGNIYQQIKLECIVETFHKSFKACFIYLENQSRDLLSSIYEGLQHQIRFVLRKAVKGNDYRNDEHLELLFNYLDNQIEVISFNLYSELFKKVMRKCWTFVTEALRDLLLPENPESDPVNYDHISMIRTSLEQLRAYFCTDSQEIPTHFIDNKALMVNSILQLYDQSTRQLIELHRTEKDRNCDQHLRPENILKIIQIRACNKDHDAINFLQQSTSSEPGIEAKRDQCIVS